MAIPGENSMKRIVMSVFLVLLPLSAFADYQCNTTLSAVLVYADGNVNILHPVRNDYTYVCNLQTTRLGVDPATCAMWTALMLSAHKDHAPIQLYYPGTGSCATLPVYGNSPAPTYIGKYTP
jgi:hypothetical protein